MSLHVTGIQLAVGDPTSEAWLEVHHAANRAVWGDAAQTIRRERENVGRQGSGSRCAPTTSGRGSVPCSSPTASRRCVRRDARASTSTVALRSSAATPQRGSRSPRTVLVPVPDDTAYAIATAVNSLPEEWLEDRALLARRTSTDAPTGVTGWTRGWAKEL